jgi:hypothetical protein
VYLFNMVLNGNETSFAYGNWHNRPEQPFAVIHLWERLFTGAPLRNTRRGTRLLIETTDGSLKGIRWFPQLLEYAWLHEILHVMGEPNIDFGPPSYPQSKYEECMGHVDWPDPYYPNNPPAQ